MKNIFKVLNVIISPALNTISNSTNKTNKKNITKRGKVALLSVLCAGLLLAFTPNAISILNFGALIPEKTTQAVGGVGPDDDFDGDGIKNSVDIDDDNDGVPDEVESPGCFYKAAEFESGNRAAFVTVTSGLNMNSSYNAPQKLVDGDAGTTTASYAVNFTNSQSNAGKNIYTFEFSMPVKLANIYLGYVSSSSHFINGAVVKLQGSMDGSNWTDLNTGTAYYQANTSGNVLNQGNKNYQVFSVMQNDGAYKYYRIAGVIGTIWNGGTANEVYFEMSPGVYSLYKPTCTNDIDNDGLANHFDLDSDGDGCFDKQEAGVTGATSTGAYTDRLTVAPNTAGDVGANGLSNSVETAPDNSVLNYSSTYHRYAISNTLKTCKDTDGDGVNDIVDIDDDNDGITDAAECPSGVKRITGGTINLTEGLSGTQESNKLYNQYGLIIKETQKTAPYTTISNTFNVYQHGGDSDNKFIFRQAAIGYSFEFYDPFTGDKREQESISIMAEPGVDGSNITLICFDRNGNIIYNNSSFPDGSTYSVNTSATLNNAKIHRFIVFGSNNTSGFDQLYIEALNYFTGSCDTDGDGLPNHLDLDSDGDNCPDAMESGVSNNPNASGAMSASGGGIYSGGITPGTSAAYLGNGSPAQYGANGFFNAIETTAESGTYNGTYTYNKALLSGYSECADTDGDGIFDINDIDDDNDGVLDISEGCMVETLSKTGLIVTKPNTIDFSFDGSQTLSALVDGTDANDYIINSPSGTLTNSEWFRVEFPQAIVLTYWEVGHYSGQSLFSTNSLYKVQGSIDGVVWTDLTGSLTYNHNQTGLSTQTSSNIAQFDNNTVPYKYYRYYGLGTAASGGGWATEFYFKGRCSDLDTDNDGIFNRLDLDSDNDGCSDAFEAGATTDKTANFKFPSSPDANANGLNDTKEIGTTGTINYASTYNQYALANNLAICADTDGDGTPDLTDIDDDNDGVLDATESPNCFYTAAEAGIITAVSTPLANDDGVNVNLPFMHDGTTTSVAASNNVITSGQAVNGAVIYVLEYPTAVKLTSITHYGTSFGTSATAMIQGSNNNATWIDLMTAAAAATATTKTFTVNTNSANYRYYRIVKIAGSSTPAITSYEVSAVQNTSGYYASQHPKPNCSTDTDNDGIFNHLDLDSDGDGCTDAVEAGTSGQAGVTVKSGTVKNGSNGMVSSTTTNPIASIGGPYGSNGFADILQSDSDSELYKYTYTYVNATDNAQRSCCPVISNNTISANQSVCSTTTPAQLTGSVPTINPTGETILYQWMSSTTSATTGFTNISGATAKDFTFTNAINQTTYYKRVAYTAHCSLYNDTTTAVTITVSQAPDAGTLNGNQNIIVGQTTTFSSTGSGGNWSTSNPDVATVNDSGTIVGISAGTATITYMVAGSGGCADATATRTVNVAAATDLSVSKTVNNSNPNVGSDITFTLTANNAGPSNATGVSVTDFLPSGYTFVSAVASSGTTYNNTNGTWAIGTLAIGADATLSITATVRPTGDYANTANITGNETDPTPGNNSATSTPVPKPISNISVTKTVDNSAPNVGSNVTFTITATNAGPSAATGVSVNDQIPSGYTFVSAATSTGTSYNSNTGIWSINNLASGENATLEIVATVNATGSYANTARISGNETDPGTDNNTSTSTPTPKPVANLSVSKTVSNSTPQVGESVTFNITAANVGPSTATGVSVSDKLPSGYTFISATPSGSTTYNTATGAWSIGTLESGANATLSIVAAVSATGNYTNTATITGSETDPAMGNNSASATPSPTPVADVSVSKTASSNTPNVGSNVTFTITANNAGPSPATEVKVNDLLPNGYTFVSATPSGSTTYNTGTGLWTIGSLPSANTATLTIVATVKATGNYSNTATITGNETDPTPGNNTSTSTPTPTPVSDLSVTKTVDNSNPEVGSNVTFTLTASNAGPSMATNVSISDELPNGYTFVSATPSQNTSYDAATGIWNVGSLAFGSNATLAVVATVNANGNYANTASITGSETDPTPSNNTATSTPTPKPVANLSVSKTVDNSSPNVGSNVTFTITASNAGPSDATGVNVTDQLPNGYTLVSATPSGSSTYNSVNGTWNIGSLTNGANATLSIVAAVKPTGNYANTASIAGNEIDPSLGNNTATNTPTPVAVADVSLIKTVNRATPNVGSSVTFFLTASNDGPSAATDVNVIDQLPDGYTFVSATPSGNKTYNATTGLWNIGSLASGANATLEIVAVVNATGNYTNTATITANEMDPTSANNTATSTPQPVPIADLSIDKTSNGQSSNVGDNVTFILTATNDGPSTATGVNVSDLLPSGYTFVSATASGSSSYNSNTGVWNIGSLLDNASATLSIVAKINATGNYANTATINGNETDPNSADNSSTVTLTPGAVADISIYEIG